MSKKSGNNSSNSAARSCSQLDYAFGCFFWASVCVPLLYVGGEELTNFGIFYYLILIISGLSASSIGLMLACAWKRFYSISLMAIITFVFLSIHIWIDLKWYYEEIYILYFVIGFVFCGKWFFITRWRSAVKSMQPNPNLMFIGSSSALKQVKLAYLFIAMSAIGMPIWSAILFRFFGYLSTFIFIPLNVIMWITLVTGVYLSFKWARVRKLFVLGFIVFLTTVYYWLNDGKTGEIAYAIRFFCSTILCGQWFLFTRFNPNVTEKNTDKSLWQNYQHPDENSLISHEINFSKLVNGIKKESFLISLRRRVITSNIALFIQFLTVVVAALSLIVFTSVWLNLMWRSFVEELEFESPLVGLHFPIILYLFIASYALFFLLPFIFSLPLTLWISFTWKTPSRILLLRPFHRGHASRRLKNLVRSEVANLGHVYTLADTDINVPWYVTLPLILGQLSFFTFRYMEVRRPNQLHRLVRVMERRKLRNFNWAVSRSKVFPVATTNFAWVHVVHRLLLTVDIIIIDLSGFKIGVVKELELCTKLGLLDRVVCVVDEPQSSIVEEKLQNCKEWGGLKVFKYNKNKVSNQEDFKLQLVSALTNTGGSK